MLDIIRTSHSRNPWCLAWKGQPLEDISFPRKREAATWKARLETVADWTVNPTEWDEATREKVLAMLATVPSIIALELARRRPR